jgi:hypothetical protein
MQRTQDRPATDESGRDDDAQRSRADESGRSNIETPSIAHDRHGDADGRSFSRTRESDELGSELERETGIEEGGNEDIDSSRTDR